MTNASELVKYLYRNRVEFRVHRHLPTFSAHDVALATHSPDDEIAKTLLVQAGKQKWLIVLRADYRIDQHLLRDALETHDIHLVPEDELESLFPGCDVGAMPPFGNLFGLPVIVDSAIADREDIVFNACTHTDSIRMKFADFERLAEPMVVTLALPRQEHERQLAE